MPRTMALAGTVRYVDNRHRADCFLRAYRTNHCTRGFRKSVSIPAVQTALEVPTATLWRIGRNRDPASAFPGRVMGRRRPGDEGDVQAMNLLERKEPGCGMAAGLLLSAPFWGLIGLGVWLIL